jgi:hypothetical protein
VGFLRQVRRDVYWVVVGVCEGERCAMCTQRSKLARTDQTELWIRCDTAPPGLQIVLRDSKALNTLEKWLERRLRLYFGRGGSGRLGGGPGQGGSWDGR